MTICDEVIDVQFAVQDTAEETISIIFDHPEKNDAPHAHFRKEVQELLQNLTLFSRLKVIRY